MWVQVLTAPKHFELQEAPTPCKSQLGDGQVVVRLLAGGICGSDLPHYKGRLSRYPGDDASGAARMRGFPLHEIVGEIVEDNGTDLSIGTRVAGWADMSNGLAEQFIDNATAVVPLEPEFDSVQATAIQPMACVLHAVSRLPSIEGKRIAIIGQGPFGLLFSHVLKAKGAARIIGIDQVDRSDVASDFGLDETVCSSSDRWVQHLGESGRPDIVIEAVGHQTATFNDAIEAVAVGGYIFYFGIADEPYYPFHLEHFMRKHLTLGAGTTRDQRRCLAEATQYLKVHPELMTTYITHVFSVFEAQLAYELAERAKPWTAKGEPEGAG